MSQFESQFEADLYAARREKLAQIAALGQPSYPNSFAFTHTLTKTAADIPALLPLGLHPDGTPQSGTPKSAEDLEAEHLTAAIAGRIVAIRLQGKAGFATLLQNGARLQIYVRKDDVGEDLFNLYKLLDLGDHIGVRGHLFRTRTGELTVHVAPSGGKPAISFLAKAMLALPDKYHGLEDTELRYRQRYVDLFMNTGAVKASGDAAESETAESETPNVREVCVKRAAVLRAIRRFFDDLGYLEVETPMMHQVAGGAAAQPFTTHHNALDLDLFLRIAPELYLKRLVVGGLDRVYEINRNFRNEGISTRHNPEFTMLEFYQAYANYHDLMKLSEELIIFVAKEVNGTTITHFNGHKIDLGKWTKLSMREAIIHFWPESAGAKPQATAFATNESVGALVQQLRHANIRIDYDSTEPVGKTIATIFETVAESHLIQPTIIYDFPLAVSPLSKKKPDEPDWVERFEFYIGGFEVGNAFSELNDPVDQLARFEQQMSEKDRGDDEAMDMDEDYVRALGYGLPPTAGEGIGIDRLTMVLTNSKSIRDVILFPLLRPLARQAETDEGKHGESAE